MGFRVYQVFVIREDGTVDLGRLSRADLPRKSRPQKREWTNVHSFVVLAIPQSEIMRMVQ